MKCHWKKKKKKNKSNNARPFSELEIEINNLTLSFEWVLSRFKLLNYVKYKLGWMDSNIFILLYTNTYKCIR